VDLVLAQVVGLDRAERVQADLEGDRRQLDAARLE
jgi:hypothetical protein